MKGVAEKILQERIIAVVVFKEQREVEPVVESLLEGGVRILELALRTDYALEALELVQKSYPEVVAGAGTVIQPQQVSQLKKLKVPFAVAPGLNRKVLERAQSEEFPFYPGIATATEIEIALEYNIRLLKLFPAAALGGMDYLKNMSAPYAHLGIKYIPLGGIDLQNLEKYLRSPLVGAVGGSWLSSRDLIEAEEWKTIREMAAKTTAIVRRVSA